MSRMSRRFAARLLFATLLLAAPAHAACPVDTIAWLTGSWSATRNGVREEEHWMAPRAGVMMGMNRIATDTKLRGFEFFRIETRGDSVFYMSSPGGRHPATPFRLTECGPGRVVFENPAHDFPQRVIYQLVHPDTLHARIEGTMKGKFSSANWTWTRGALAP